MSEYRRSYPDFKSVDDCIAMFERFGPQKTPPEFLITLYDTVKKDSPYGDRTKETQIGGKWYSVDTSKEIGDD